MVTVTLNVLFLGETNLGDRSIIDLIASPNMVQKRFPRHARLRALGNDTRSITLDGKMFKLHALPASQSLDPAVLREGIQNILVDLRQNGGIHLLVYCMNALHSTLWIHEIHRTVNSNLALSPRIPVVAVVTGISDVAQQENWWSRNEDALANQGFHFDDHAFIRVMITGDQSPRGNHISESRHALHILILQHCTSILRAKTDSDIRRTPPYKQRSTGNSFQSLFAMSSVKASSHTYAGSKAIDIVLVGEIGVGKSSLINLITKGKVAEVSPDTVGCTKNIAKYVFEENGRTFHLYDTPGLVDPLMGTKPFIDPIDTIQRLIHSLGNSNGPDLVLFCIDNSRPTVALRRNYRLFYKIICEGRVPFVLAITKLEEDQGANRWWSRHEATIRSYGIDCSGHVGIGHEKKHPDPNLDPSRVSLLISFVTCADRHWQRHRIRSLFFSTGRALGLVTSVLCSQPSMLEDAMMKQCGLEEQTARELANRIVSSRQPYGATVHP